MPCACSVNATPGRVRNQLRPLSVCPRGGRDDGVSAMDDDRLTRAEERIAYQEQAISELSDVLHRQQAQIDQLTVLCTQLGERLVAASEGEAGDPLDEKPPHY
ncbi:MAG: hypothetical protein DRR03_01445 [Gammaproteobacteria bacterium]|nr:MAG: hypothetical protein DRR03_01445 [Gammaproteobacteria bacterium]